MSLLPPEQPTAASGAPASASGSGYAAPTPPTPPVPPKPPTPAEAAAPAAPAKPESGTSSLLSNLRVSLMPSDLEGRPAPNLARGLVIMAAVLAVETVIIGVLYYMAGRAINSRIGEQAQLQADIERTDKETVDLEMAATPAVAYAYQLRVARDTLDNHLYWSPFLAFLEKNTRPTVKYTTFTGDAVSGTVSVDCVGLTYRDVAEQIVSLRESPMVSEVRSNSASAKVTADGKIEGVSFSMMIRFKPEAWKVLTAPATAAPAAEAPATEGTQPAVTAPVDSTQPAP